MARRYSRELRVALEAAKAAGDLQLSRRDKALRVRTKNDESPVTAVDRACEQRIMEIIGAHFPADGFLGEETGAHSGTSGRRWIIDPLDGTRPYIRGIPTYSALIALEDGHDLAVGVMHLPAMALTCWAASGSGAFCNGTRIRVSRTSTLAAAMGSALGFRELRATAAGRRLLDFTCTWGYAYGFMDAYSYVALACGKLDVCVNLLDKAWDCAAAACIVTEAGGRYSDLGGNATVHTGTIILTNGVLHDRAVEYFAKPAGQRPARRRSPWRNA